MQFQDKHAKLISSLGHIIAVVAGITSGALLFVKFSMSGWHIVLSTLVSLVAGVILILASEAFAIFSLNITGLCLQKSKPIKEIKDQLIYSLAGVAISGLLLFSLAYISINNIVSFQTLKRDEGKIEINALPTVAPLHQTVKSLELAFEGANNEYQSAQERFKSYQGTNQYQNQGKANQAAVKAQNRKDRLEEELRLARASYLSVYNTEVTKGTNLIDRAEGGNNSKIMIAGMIEIGTPLVVLLSVMLSAFVRARSTVFSVNFEDAQEPPAQPEQPKPQQLEAPKSEVKIQEVVGKPVSELTLAEMILKVYRRNLPQKEITVHFGYDKSKVSRMVYQVGRLAAEYQEQGENRIDAELHAVREMFSK